MMSRHCPSIDALFTFFMQLLYCLIFKWTFNSKPKIICPLLSWWAAIPSLSIMRKMLSSFCICLIHWRILSDKENNNRFGILEASTDEKSVEKKGIINHFAHFFFLFSLLASVVLASVVRIIVSSIKTNIVTRLVYWCACFFFFCSTNISSVLLFFFLFSCNVVQFHQNDRFKCFGGLTRCCEM